MGSWLLAAEAQSSKVVDLKRGALLFSAVF